MTNNEIKRRFPNASRAFIEANLADDRALQASMSQRPFCNAPVGKVEGKKESPSRFRVHLESRRTRLVDPDAICGKWILDCIRYAGYIPDDSAKHIEYSVSQVKVPKGQDCTVITVEEI